ncbi:hypothetical protein SBA4_3500003 [Candidatus Sulfopaludibacter sp. SbA4]|nr:hypothetical protein SBA4_3500003 [Candidatus Sulfopaludibacter sp. SbA4]
MLAKIEDTQLAANLKSSEAAVASVSHGERSWKGFASGFLGFPEYLLYACL